MTYEAMLAASIVRSIAVVLAGLAGAEILSHWIQQSRSSGQRRWRIAFVAAPFLMPNLAVGYGYRGISLTLLNEPWLNEILYFLLICFEATPAAVWLWMYGASPAVSREAIHCARLAAMRSTSLWRSWRWRAGLWWRGPASRRLAPAAILFLLSFQESELAALMQVRSWPERVFTEATRGLPPIPAAKLVALPVLLQIACLVPLIRYFELLRTTRGLGGRTDMAVWKKRRLVSGLAMIWIVAAIALVIGEPSWRMAVSSWSSGRVIALQPRWFRELGDAVLLATTCAAVTWAAAMLVLRLPTLRQGPRARWTPGARLIIRLSLIPGLTGTLALGLLVAAVFQRLAPTWAYTPLPLLLAEFLWLWPRALIVCGAMESGLRMAAYPIRLLGESPVKSQQVQATKLWWIVSGHGLLGGVFLVWWWSYMEVMLPQLLGTSGFQPAPWLLYNHLHFGQIPALGVKLVLILAVPAMLLLVSIPVLRRLAR